MAAPSAKLGLLHELFTEYQIHLLTRTEIDDEGNEYKVWPSAAEAAVIRAFLKDNGVQADPDACNDVKDVANFARKAMIDAGVDTSEVELLVQDFQNFGGTRLQ